MAGSFGFRQLLWSVAALLAAVGLIYFASARSLERQAMDEARERAGHTLQAVEWLVRTSAPTRDLRAFDAWVIELGGRLETRITYIAAGKVLADSHVDPAHLAELEDHAGRPEVRQALERGEGQDVRFSATLNRRMIYRALRMAGLPAQLPDGVLRVATPALEVEARMAAAKRQAVPVLLAVCACAAGLIWLAVRSMARTVRAFSAAVQEIGRGDFERRIRLYPGAEFRPLAEAINAMAGNISKQVRTIALQKSQREAVFEGLAEGVAVIGGDGRIQDANAALGALFGCPGLIRRTLLEACLNMDIQGTVQAMLAEPERVAPLRLETALRDGRAVEAVLVPSGTGQDRRLILVVRDLSEARRSEKAMRGFLINAAHWLRTPLTSVQGYIETAMDAPPHADSRAMLAVALRAAQEMAAVVQGLLALAKARAASGDGPAQAMAADAGAALDRALAAVTPALEAKGVGLTIDARPHGPLPVAAEADGLAFAIQAVLDKALRATPAGGLIRLAALPGEGRLDIVAAWGGQPQDPRHAQPADTAAELLSKGDMSLAMAREVLAAFGGSLGLSPACASSGIAGEAGCAARIRLAAAPATPST